MSAVLKKFGKYFLLDLIAQGGMAEIFRARMETPDGGARLVAIKRMLGNFTKNQDFVKMFKAEIFTTSSMNHPNVVQIYDFGETNGQLYLSMELIDGKNLRQVINRSIENNLQMPLEISLQIVAQAASGMAYAHALKDKFSGANQNIVHRDISPQNILLSYDGTVKMIDFGIAKAMSNSENTKTGIIKGKPSYLSPEQIQGLELDGRSDIFALGVVLWEILVGRKLFQAENDYAVIKMIENCNAYVKPPSQFNESVPKDVDQIVLKCLEKDRDNRFKNADELHRALKRFLNINYPDASTSEMSEYIKVLFKNEIIKDRQTLMRLNEKAMQLLTIEPAGPKDEFASREQTATVPMKESGTSNLDNKNPRTMAGYDNSRTKSHVKSYETVKEFELKKEDQRTSIHIEKSSTAQGTQNINYEVQNNMNYSAPRVATEKRTEKRIVEVKKSKFPFAAAIIFFSIIGAAGYFYMNPVVDSKGGRKVAQDKSAASSNSSGTVVVEGSEGVTDATIKINGKVVASKLPATIPDLTADKEYTIEADSNGLKKPDIVKVVLKKGEVKNIFMAFVPEISKNTKSDQFSVRLKVTPLINLDKTEIKINGKTVDSFSPNASVSFDTPFDIEVLKEGFDPYRKSNLKLSRSDLNGKTEWMLDIQLKEATFGLLSVQTVPSYEYIIISANGEDLKVPMPVKEFKLPQGKYKLKIINESLSMYYEKDVDIKQNQKLVVGERLSAMSKEKILKRLPGSVK